jgi:hypothetical protein
MLGSLYRGAENQRQQQVNTYNKDKAHNQVQQDSVRRAQYSKQNRAVNRQKQHMADNSAKSSRLVTGSSAYNKEAVQTLDGFLALCEGKQKKDRAERRAEGTKKSRKKEADDAKKEANKEQARKDEATPPPKAKKRSSNLAAFRAQRPETPKKEEPKAEAPKKEPRKPSRAEKWLGRQAGKAKRSVARSAKRATDRTPKKEAGRTDYKNYPTDKKEVKAHTKAVARRHSGLRAGVKQALGGDKFSRDYKTRMKARKEFSKSATKGALSVPGKVARGTYKGAKYAGGKALEGMRAARQYEVGSAGENNKGVADVDQAKD